MIRLQSLNTNIELSREFGEGEYTIGRHFACHLEVPSTTVSRQHAKLEITENGRIYLADLGSRNGTMVNGKQIHDTVVLRPNDTVTFGEVRFRVIEVKREEPCSKTAQLIDDTLDSAIIVPVSSVRIQRPGRVLSNPDTFLALATMGRVAVDPQRLEDILHRSLQLLHDALGAERLAVLQWDDRENKVSINAQYATGPLAEHEFWVSRAVLSDVHERRVAMLVSDVEADETLSQRTSVIEAGVKSLMAVPLIAEDEVHGILYADTTSADQRFNNEHLQAFVTFADTLAAKIANFKLIREREKKAVIEAELRVAESKRAEIEQAHAELQQAQVQLVQSEKHAALGRMVAGITHELNNPLGYLRSSVDMLCRSVKECTAMSATQKASLDDDLRSALEQVQAFDKHTETINSAIDRVTALLKRLKSYAGLDTAEWQDADVNTGLRDTIAFLTPDLGERITVKTQLNDIPIIHCSLPLLNQAFLAVVTNAIEAIEEQGTITIESSSCDDHIVITIADTGKGIAGDELTHVFDPGFSTKERRIKMGLGLATCRQIIQRHDGSIDLQSEPGNGTRVTIELPVPTKSCRDPDMTLKMKS